MDQANNYHELDDIWIEPEDEDEVVLGIGLVSQFWFPDGDTVDKRRAVLDVADSYARTFPDEVYHFQKAGASRLSRAKGRNWYEYYDGLLQTQDPDDDLFSVHIKDWDSLNHNFVESVASSTDLSDEDQLSYLMSSVAPSWAKANLDKQVELTLSWCEKLSPDQATCGFAPIAERGMLWQRDKEYWPFLARFCGFDHFFGMGLSVHAGEGPVKFNWLTALCDDYVKQLGGIDAIAEGLHPEGDVLPYAGGVLIRACTHPQMGDVSIDNWPAAYVAVNNLIKPIRFSDIAPTPMAQINVPEPLDRQETTLEWLQRFDERSV